MISLRYEKPTKSPNLILDINPTFLSHFIVPGVCSTTVSVPDVATGASFTALIEKVTIAFPLIDSLLLVPL